MFWLMAMPIETVAQKVTGSHFACFEVGFPGCWVTVLFQNGGGDPPHFCGCIIKKLTFKFLHDFAKKQMCTNVHCCVVIAKLPN